MLPTNFHPKTPILYSGQISWPVGLRSIFKKKNLTGFFFVFVCLLLFIFLFLQKIFPFVSWNSKYAIYKFSCKTSKIVFRRKFLPLGHRGIFKQILVKFLTFLAKDFSNCFLDLWIYYEHVFLQKRWTCISAKILSQSEYLFFFLQKYFFHLFLWPLYMFLWGLCLRPKPKIRWMLAQWTQNNKFVESGVKNWVFMNWTIAGMTPRGKFNIITDTNKYRFPV